MNNESDIAGICAAIKTYFHGHAKSEASHFRECFFATARIEGFRGDQWVSWSLDEYCAIFKGTPAPDENTRRRTIDAIDVTGPAAMAKATLTHGAITFTDYFVLLKKDGAWKIANKVFSSV